jgi:hypothetical protein
MFRFTTRATSTIAARARDPLDAWSAARGTALDARASVRFASLVIALVGIVACRPPGYGKGDDTPPDETPDAATGDGSVDSPAAATCAKSFRLDGRSTASSVWISGSFVEWGGDPEHGAIEFTLGADGGWTVTHDFEAGAHQYKFIVNATEWIVDPTNPDQVDDGFGGKNSLYLCAP